MNNQYDTLSGALEDLKKKGYDQNFIITSEGLYCPRTEQTFLPKDVHIVEFHRFEGETNVSDMSIAYALETSGNCKGVIVDAYGTYSDTIVSDFIKQVEFKKVST